MSEKSSLSIGLMRKERQRKYTCIVATRLRLSLARSNQRKQCIMSRLLEERKNPYETIILFVSGSFAQTELSRCSGGETLRDSARYRCIFLLRLLKACRCFSKHESRVRGQVLIAQEHQCLPSEQGRAGTLGLAACCGDRRGESGASPWLVVPRTGCRQRAAPSALPFVM